MEGARRSCPLRSWFPTQDQGNKPGLPSPALSIPGLSDMKVEVKRLSLLIDANSDPQPQLWGCNPDEYLREKCPALDGLLFQGQPKHINTEKKKHGEERCAPRTFDALKITK